MSRKRLSKALHQDCVSGSEFSDGEDARSTPKRPPPTVMDCPESVVSVATTTTVLELPTTTTDTASAATVVIVPTSASLTASNAPPRQEDVNLICAEEGAFLALFRQVDHTSYICKFPHSAKHKCHVSVSTSNKTANLKRHAETYHADLAKQLMLISSPLERHDLVHRLVDKAKADSKREEVSSYFKPISESPIILQAHAKLVSAMIRHGVAFHFIEDQDLADAIALLRSLPNAKKLPSRRTVCRGTLPSLYKAVLAKVTEDLTAVEFPAISFTADSWTGIGSRQFITITISYVNKAFVMTTRCLALCEVHESQTAVVVMQLIRSRLHSLLPHNTMIHAAVTDQGANFKSASTQFVGGDSWLPCFAHVLNLCVKSCFDIPEVSTFVCMIRETLSAFKSGALRRIVSKIKEVNAICASLDTDCPTRWNSTLAMIQRFLTLLPALNVCFGLDEFLTELGNPTPTWALYFMSKGFVLSALVKDFIGTLQHLQELSVMVQTNNMVLPIATHSLYQLKQRLTTLDDEMSRKLLHEISQRFDFLFSNVNVALLSCAMHPDFATLDFIESSLREQVWAAVSNCFDSLTTSPDEDDDNSVTDSDDICSRLRKRLQKYHDLHAYDVPGKNVVEDSCQHVRDFYCDNLATSVQQCRPLARMLLSVPASSAESERVFSRAGFTLSARRNRLSGEMLELQVVAAHNLSCGHLNTDDLLPALSAPAHTDESDEDEPPF
jgi:hypothetical protein